MKQTAIAIALILMLSWGGAAVQRTPNRTAQRRAPGNIAAQYDNLERLDRYTILMQYRLAKAIHPALTKAQFFKHHVRPVWIEAGKDYADIDWTKVDP